MDVSIKAGTNPLQGSLFGQFTSDKLDANNWLSDLFGDARPRESSCKCYSASYDTLRIHPLHR
jgi:hypothetical protein